jgi:hypothetical protein
MLKLISYVVLFSFGTTFAQEQTLEQCIAAALKNRPTFVTPEVYLYIY